MQLPKQEHIKQYETKENSMQPNYHLVRESIIGSGDSAQAFTTSWADLGSEIDMYGYSKLGVWLTLDVNAANNMRLRALAKLDAGSGGDSSGAEFQLPINSVGSSDVKVEGEYYEFNVDADGNFLLEIETDGLIPIIQLQIQVGTDGGADAEVDYCQITKRA